MSLLQLPGALCRMCATPRDVFIQGATLNPFWKAGERRFLFAEAEQEVG